MSRVLHIEDDPRNRLLVRKLLSAEGDRDTSAAVGCDGFVQKPIDARVFGSQIRGFLRGLRAPFASSPDATGERLRLQSGRIVAHLEEKVAELSTANERLREMERLRAEFYRNISHELATPLTPIVGYLRMLVDEELGGVSKPQLKALRAMDDCVRRLRATLDNLIDVTGLETGRMKFFHREYDFLDTVRRATSVHAEKLAERRIVVLEQLPRGPLPAVGDSDRLGRAIGQLLDNAAKFTPEGGTVGLAVWRVDSHYAVMVADSGPGIPEQRADRIFEPFLQLDGSPTRAHGGVGVGLAIARRIAQGHGGDIQLGRGAVIQGRELRGAAFTLSVLVQPPSDPRPTNA